MMVTMNDINDSREWGVNESLIVKSIVNVPERQTILIILSEYITLLFRLEVRIL